MRKQWILQSAALAALGLMVGCQGELGFAGPDGDAKKDGWPQVNNTQPNNVDTNNAPEPGEIDPGRVTLRRLNRTEYNNTVRDLLGDTSNIADTFPEDDFGYGFNNIGDVLSISPLHIDSYHLAAEQLIETALDPGIADPTIQRYEAESVTQTVGSGNNGYWNLFSNGEVTTVHTFPADADYKFTVRAYQTAAGPANAQMTVAVNGQVVQTFDVPNTSSNPGVFEVTAPVNAGGQSISVGFTNDYYDADLGEDRNLLVDWFEVEGPLGVNGDPSPMRAQILTCDPATAGAEACAAEVIGNFGKKAWRRPLEEAEVTRLVQFVTLALSEDDTFDVGIKLALRAILMSPNFLFRVELDEDVNNATPHALTDHELASRLSYFLWSTMPDDELFQLADAGQLNDETVLKQQVQRMLDDPKAIALIDTMATQWLYIDSVLTTNPDYDVFPDFDQELKEGLRGETRAFVKHLIDTNAPLNELLTANYTFLNARVAAHYGVSGITGDGFVQHTWEDDTRRGIIGHGGLLTATSHPTMTSPVKRGEWILSNMLCSEPPAPPPGVEGLVAPPPGSTDGKTMRERLAEHAANPSCAACHFLMDPIGLGMENFDATGAWRDNEGGLPIDPSGELPGDVLFSGPTELAQILGAHDKFPGCATEKIATFALGRGIKDWDEPFIEHVVSTTAPDGHRFRDLIETIVVSDSFRMRRGGTLKSEQE